MRLCRDLRRTFDLDRSAGTEPAHGFYIGGGTPTILNPDQLRLLLGTVAEMTDVSRLEEFTLEAGRPDTIDADKLAVARSFGVGRVSVNPQILCDEVLHSIGRAHDTEMFFRAYEIARASGIPVVNTDLIAGLPGDRFPTFSASLTRSSVCARRTSRCIPSASSAPDLRRGGGDIYSMRGGDTGKCVDYSQIQCIHEGYVPYYMYRQKNTVGNFENVGFALPGYEGLYNIYMMEEVHSIFAVGAGAVTKLVDYAPADGSARYINRLFNPSIPTSTWTATGIPLWQSRQTA